MEENFFPNNERRMIINLLEYEWKVKAWFRATRYKLDFGVEKSLDFRRL